MNFLPKSLITGLLLVFLCLDRVSNAEAPAPSWKLSLASEVGACRAMYLFQNDLTGYVPENDSDYHSVAAARITQLNSLTNPEEADLIWYSYNQGVLEAYRDAFKAHLDGRYGQWSSDVTMQCIDIGFTHLALISIRALRDLLYLDDTPFR